MGHFTIQLPGNRQGDVRWGTIKKSSLFSNLFKKSNTETKKGYIVKIDPASPGHKEYRLLKTSDGKWTSEDSVGFLVTPDNEMTASIKTAIDNYESEQ